MDTRFFACDTSLDLSGWIAAIDSELERLNIQLSLNPINEESLTVSVPEAAPACLIKLEVLHENFAGSLAGYDFSGTGQDALRKQYLLTMSGDREDPAVNFIFNLMTKVIGRITHGTMIDVEMEYVTDDWVTWGYDYYDGDMFEAFASVGLDQQYPTLRRP